MSTLVRPQHLDALDAANRIRLERAGLRRMLKIAPTRARALRAAADVVEANPTCVASMPVSELLLSCRQVGDSSIDKLLRDVQLSRTVTVAALTDRQRHVAVSQLRLLSRGPA